MRRTPGDAGRTHRSIPATGKTQSKRNGERNVSKDQFTKTMQVLFQVWEGTKNADEILENACRTFGRCFGYTGENLPEFVRLCRGE